MKKLDEYPSKETAINAANQFIDSGYVVVVTAHINGYRDEDGPHTETWFTIWGTKARTVMTGGWNR